MIIFSYNGHHIVTSQKIASTGLKSFFEQNTSYKKTELPSFVDEHSDTINDVYTFIVRNPRQRYISGLCEVLQGTVFYGIENFKNTTLHKVDIENKNSESAQRLFDDFQYVENKMNWLMKIVRNDLSFGNDPHTENWLYNILIKLIKGYSVEIIDLTDLDNWVNLNFDLPMSKDYVKSKKFKNNIEQYIQDNESFVNFKYYILSEQNTYDWITSETFKNLSIYDKENKAKDLIIETMGNVFGHETFKNHHNLFYKEHLNHLQDILDEIEEI